MRLIDADELKKRAVKVCFPDVPDCGEFDAVGVSDIDIMPTIKPESLRPTANWNLGEIDFRDVILNFVCDKCGGLSEEDYPYCPHYGARMVNADE
jgi:hypothetical protein